MIEINQLRVVRNGTMICKVDEFSQEPGQRIAVVGANGSGKTTLLRVVSGLERMYSGNCIVSVTNRQRTFVHQHPLLFRGSVRANVCYGLRRGNSSSDVAMEWLTRLGLRDFADRSAAQLSGGEIRRVALARALARRPKLLILDEPLAELDPAAVDNVCQTLDQLTDTTIMLASPVELPSELNSTRFHLE